jgi:hypothetical protein
MADFIEVISQETFNQTQKYLSLLEEIDTSIDKINASAKQAQYPSQAKAVIEATNKEIQKSNNVVEKSIQIKERQRLAELKLASDREKTFDKYERQLKREEAAIRRTEGIYNKIQQKVNSVLFTYNNLAAKQELGLKLSKQEEAQLIKTEAQLNKYQKVLLSVDQRIGINKRNVGNYISGWNGLGNSINQITREFPNFAINAQIGILALSNNIPILADEINRLILRNKELAAQGQPVKSAFSQILKAVFSWQTGLSLGITLFTIYGKEIGEFISTLFKGSSASKSFAATLGEVNEKAAELAGQEMGTFKALTTVIQDNTKSEKERLAAKKELNDKYPDFNAKIFDEKRATNEVNKAIDDYIVKLGNKAKAQAALTMIQEEYTKLIKQEAETERARAKLTKIDPSTIENEEERTKVIEKQAKEVERLVALNKSREDGNKATPATMQNFNVLARPVEVLNNSLEKEADIRTKINNLLKIYTTNIDESTITTTNAAEETSTAIKGSIRWLEEQIDKLEKLRDETALNSTEYEKFTEKIVKLQLAIEAIKGLQDAMPEGLAAISPEQVDLLNKAKSIMDGYVKKLDEAAKTTGSLQVATDKFLNSFSFGFLEQSGLPSLTKFFDGEFEKILAGAESMSEKFAVYFTAISESAQEAFNFIAKASSQNFEQQLLDAEKAKDIALKFAEGDADAKIAIQEQYEAKRREIQREQAEQQKRLAIFNILINTAQAVVAALASVPPNVPLSIAVGIIGALQAGIVAATPIPEFAKGTRNFKGGLAIVGDGGRKEVIRTPNNQFYVTPNKNTLVDLPKGSDVYKSIPDFEANLNKVVKYSQTSTSMPNFNYQEFDRIFGKNLKSLQKIDFTMDKNGFSIWMAGEHSRRAMKNNRVTFKGQRV